MPSDVARPSFRMRISACSEEVAAEVAHALLGYAEAVVGAHVRPLDLTLDPPATKRRFEPVTSWDWTTAVERVHGLHPEGVNVIVLSERFWDWRSREQFINDELEAFDGALIELGISAVEVGALCQEEKRRLSGRFSEGRTWHEATAGDFIRRMENAGRATASPLIEVPATTVDPRIAQFSAESGRQVRVFTTGTFLNLVW